MPPGVSTSDFYYILPELVLTAGALVVLVADVLLARFPLAPPVARPFQGRDRGPESPALHIQDRYAHGPALAWITIAVLGATFASLLPFTATHVEVAHGLLAVDRFALFF